MNEPVEHSLNWCRLCRTCLTCPRNPRRVFSQDGCACEERLMRHHFKDVQGNGTTDFRFRHLTREENRGLVNLLNQMDSTAPDIEPNLVRANLCGTCQQRLRRAVEAAIEPPEAPSERTFDFRRRRSIRATISERNTNAAAANTMTSSGSTHRMSPVLEGAAEPQIIRHHTSAPMSLAPGTNQPGDTQQLQQRAPTGGGGVPSSMAAAAASAAQPSPQRFGDADNPLFEEPQRLGSIEFDSRASTSPRGFRGRSVVIHITILDAGGTRLFSERVHAEMTLHELFYAYYPDAPRTILFREQSSGCLVSPRLSVLKIPQVDSMIVVKVHVPHGVPRINWDAPTLNPIDASAATMAPLPPASSLMDSQMHHPTGSLQFDQPPPHHASLARSQNPVRVSASEPQVVSSVPTLIPPQLRAPLRDPHQHPQSSHSRFTVDVALQAEQDQQSPTKSIPEKRLRL